MDPRVETAQGWLEGLNLGRYQSFRGIPFALQPSAALRMQRTHPPEPWGGTRPALEYGAPCPQPPSMLAGLQVTNTSEKCLWLNVDTPRADGGRRPVLVWIHGGAFTSGSGSAPLYDGGRLAVRGDVVVVTLNYRLGALGYLYLAQHGGEAIEATANAASLDQLAALQWVQKNIAAFGGDPGNVTVFGESAGAMSIATLCGMPASRGLFHKMILQSGAAHSVLTPEFAGLMARTVLDELGIAPQQLESLRKVPVDALVAAQTQAVAKLGFPSLSFAPVVDGDTLPRAPLASIAAGELRDIPVLIGTNLDEIKLFRIGAPRTDVSDAASLIGRVRRHLPVHAAHAAPQIVEAYRKAREERGASTDPLELLDAIESDLRFRVPAIRFAEAQSKHQRHTYMYLWTWPSPAADGTLGACHGVELPFVFGTLDAPGMDRFAGSGVQAEWLSAQVMDVWIAFARTGRPRNVGWPDWPPYNETQRHTFEIGRVPRLLSSPLDTERICWEGVS